ncbi:MAG: hypothetical protein E7112_00850 [Bacteroidales bacterium]|nr:hypothetical protein [Bacteroidales bacterium]
MQNDIASKLLDENGQLKKFDRWVEDIKGMTNHYVGPWLRTEYNTAVLRAHQAADWKHFEAEADIFPNVRWMPTTSPQQDPLHRQYWEKKLTLPVNHPFWEQHRPGDRWNCKCTLQQTDDPVNDEVIRDFYPVPQQKGLDNNPADDGKLFSDSHPYITKSYAGAQAAVGAKLDIPFDREFATVDEAFDFIKEYIAEEVTLTIKKSQLKNLTPILNQVANRMREFGIPKFKNFGKPANKNAYASWDSTTNSLNIGQKLLNNPSGLWKIEMAWRKRGVIYSPVASEDDVIRYVIDHELGHKLMYQYNMKSDAMRVQGITGVTRNGFNELYDVLGYYATKDVDEFFAEAFACYYGPNRNKMVETKKMIERLIAKAKPNVQKVSEMRVRTEKVLRSTTRDMIDMVLDNVHRHKPINASADLGQIDKPVVAFLKKRDIQPSTDRLIVSDVGMQHALRATKAAKGIGMPETDLVEALSNLAKCDVYFDDDKKNIWYVWNTPQQSYKLVFDFDEKIKVDRIKLKVNQLTTAGKVNASDLKMKNIIKIR